MVRDPDPDGLDTNQNIVTLMWVGGTISQQYREQGTPMNFVDKKSIRKWISSRPTLSKNYEKRKLAKKEKTSDGDNSSH